VFERFTERARQVVVLAQDEARVLRHNYIGTEHLLLGLLREEEGLAARVLESLDVSLEEVRFQVARIIGLGDEVTTGQIPFTPRGKKVLELGLREALSLGHNYIGTEHILLGLVREGEGVGIRILLDLDADEDKIRNEIVRMLGGPASGIPSSVAPLAPDLVAEIERVRSEKETALEAQDFEKAASLRTRERNLLRLGRDGDVEGFWAEAQRPLPAADVRVPRRPPRHRGRAVQWRSTAATLTQGPPPGRLAGPATTYFVVGWCCFAVALGVGVLIGWLIWGH
jgi:ATP-dependent Clp protease ATP-binding subunit ClpA